MCNRSSEIAPRDNAERCMSGNERTQNNRTKLSHTHNPQKMSKKKQVQKQGQKKQKKKLSTKSRTVVTNSWHPPQRDSVHASTSTRGAAAWAAATAEAATTPKNFIVVVGCVVGGCWFRVCRLLASFLAFFETESGSTKKK